MKTRALLVVARAVLLAACGGSPPPAHESPELSPVSSAPAGAVVLEASSDRRTWMSSEARTGTRVLDTPVGRVDVPTDVYRFVVDATDDGTAAVCSGSAVYVPGRGAWVAHPLPSFTGSDVYFCAGVATFSVGEVWVLLADWGTPYGETPQPSLLCHVAPGTESCRALAGVVAYAFARTAAHLWWEADGELVAMEPTDAATPFVVGPIEVSSLQGGTRDESVLAVGPSTRDVRRVTLDGTETRYVTAPESGAYADVWRDPEGRVLAAELLRGGDHVVCSPGFFGGGGGCGPTDPWAQLVVWELGAGAPVELGYADVDPGFGEPIGVERGGVATVFLDGDAYEIPR